MSTYFIFKGVSSAAKGLTVQTVNEPLTPSVKQHIHNPAFMDGSIDFSDLTGSLHYEDKVIEYTCRFKCADINAFALKCDELGAWLTGKGTLISARSKQYSNARCYSGIAIAPQFYGTYGEFTVSFTVGPFPDVSGV